MGRDAVNSSRAVGSDVDNSSGAADSDVVDSSGAVASTSAPVGGALRPRPRAQPAVAPPHHLHGKRGRRKRCCTAHPERTNAGYASERSARSSPGVLLNSSHASSNPSEFIASPSEVLLNPSDLHFSGSLDLTSSAWPSSPPPYSE